MHNDMTHDNDKNVHSSGKPFVRRLMHYSCLDSTNVPKAARQVQYSSVQKQSVQRCRTSPASSRLIQIFCLVCLHLTIKDPNHVCTCRNVFLFHDNVLANIRRVAKLIRARKKFIRYSQRPIKMVVIDAILHLQERAEIEHANIDNTFVIM